MKKRNLSWIAATIAAAILVSACSGGTGGWNTPAAATPPVTPPPVTPPPVTPPPVVLPESIPDFSADSSRIIIQSTLSGNWSNPATWAGGAVPTFSNVAKIASGHTVTINDTSATAYTVSVNGKLAFSPSLNTSLRVTNLQVMATGTLEVGTTTTPISDTVTAEIVIANSALGSGVADPEQFGTGILVFGKLTLHGSVRTPTFTRLATEPHATNTTLSLSQAVSGWKVGDRLVLPDTRHIKGTETTANNGWANIVNQWEERTVQAINGTTITLNSPLTFNHLGAHAVLQDGSPEVILPHVGNLTRNVVIRSESATGTRGHMLSIHTADVDIRYAAFKDLGRTTYQLLSTEGGSASNHIGRYPIHMHHLSGPPPGVLPSTTPQFTLVGNAVDGGSVETKFKWGITVHGSHYGLIQDNVVYNYNGAAIATEDGSESFNVFDHNFVMRGMGEPTNVLGEPRFALGTEGVGFWFRGPNNYVTNNVAANFQNPDVEGAYGFVFQFRFLNGIAVPKQKGSDTTVSGQFNAVDGNNLPLLQFDNNEAYGAMQGGLTFWWVSSQDPQPSVNSSESVIKNFTTWHVYNKGIYAYPAQKVTFDGLKIRGNYTIDSRCCGDGIFFADYSSKEIIIRNSDIQGMQEGIIAPESGRGTLPNLTVENSFMRNWENINVPVVGSVNTCDWMDNKLVVINNVTFQAAPGQPLSNVNMVGDVANAPVCTGKLDEVRVYSYNGNALDNFQVYHTDTTWQPRPPCTPTTRPEIDGLLCPIAPLAALSTPTRFAKAGVELAESGLNRIQVAMRKLFTAPTDTLVAMRRLFSTPADTSAMVCRATPPSM